MSEVPPQQSSSVAPPPVAPPVEIAPPPQFAGYTRNYGAQPVVGSPDKLEALGKGYFALSWLFALHFVLLFVGMITVMSVFAGDQTGPIALMTYVVLVMGIVAIACHRIMKPVCFGMNWSPVWAVLVAIFIPFAGIIGYIVVQLLISGEIAKYRVKTRFLGGYKKKDIKATVEAMRASPYYQAQNIQPMG